MQYGVLAQQVKLAAPFLVKEGSFPPKIDSKGNVVIPAQPVEMVDYVKMVPLLIQAYNEQQVQITDLQAIIQSCCGGQRTGNNEPQHDGTRQNDPLQVKLINSENAILYTNEPNPYTSSTTIRYFIPENTSDVKITFQDAIGKTLKEVVVNQTGQGSIVVDGSELINGIYTYSLVIGNKLVDTKKMVKQ